MYLVVEFLYVEQLIVLKSHNYNNYNATIYKINIQYCLELSQTTKKLTKNSNFSTFIQCTVLLYHFKWSCKGLIFVFTYYNCNHHYMFDMKFSTDNEYKYQRFKLCCSNASCESVEIKSSTKCLIVNINNK